MRRARGSSFRSERSRYHACAAVVLGSIALTGCGLPADGGRLGELRGTITDPPIPMPELELVDTDGRPFDLREQTDGYVTLLFFGYSHCPDVCPVQMATLGGALDELRPEIRNRIKPLFVSTDPERDTPERLQSWLGGFSRSFVGLSAPVDRINEALAAMKLPGVAVMPGEGDEAPMIGHPSAVLAFGPDGLARIRYGFGVRRADWVHDLPLIVGAQR